MQIIINHPNEDSVDAFLVITKTNKASAQKTPRHYEISPAGVQIGHTPEETNSEEEGRQQKYPVQILVKYGDCTWEELANLHGTYIHGIITQKDQISDREVVRLGKFAFEFSTEKRQRTRILDDLHDFAQRDIVTEAYHARYLRGILAWEIERYKRLSKNSLFKKNILPISLLQISIHRLKERRLHDGELVSDTILKEVATRLQIRLRHTDIISRWEDGFMIYLPDTDETQAFELSKKVQKQIVATPLFIGKNKEIPLNISIGIATYREDIDADTMIEEVGISLLDAKQRKSSPQE